MSQSVRNSNLLKNAIINFIYNNEKSEGAMYMYMIDTFFKNPFLTLNKVKFN